MPMVDAPSRTRCKAIVVGAGFGGMAAALRLRKLGYRVELMERGPMLGGRAQVFEKDGFRHDAGPTVITAPFLIDELFELFGRKREDYVAFAPLNPWYRFHFSDGSTFDYGGTLEETLAEIARIEPRDVEGYRALLAHSRKLYDKGFTELACQPFHQASIMLRHTPALMALGARLSVWELIAKHLVSPKLREAFSIHPLLVGGNPFDTTSVYGLIHFLERQSGVLAAQGGTGAVVAALARLMAEVGVETRLNASVSRLVVEHGAARGVALDSGETIAADIVVSNGDPMHLYRHMTPQNSEPLAITAKKRSRLSMGLFVLFFGAKRRYPGVARHTIWLGARYRELLADIFKRKILAEDFSLYVHRPSATDPSFAPEGCDSFYVLCPVPNQLGKIDWSVEGPALQARIVDALARTILPGLHEAITADFYMTPDDFAQRYLSFGGAGFSIAPHLTQSAWFRFHNKSEALADLYLVGAGTHPGAGIPGVLCSAKVLEQVVPAA